jgi:multiple sugar transport system substrate-binding protein
VEIRWKEPSRNSRTSRSATLDYDLLIIHHTRLGARARTACCHWWYLPAEYLNDQALNSAGQSHNSYNYKGKQWALAIDAATPAASYRKDLAGPSQILGGCAGTRESRKSRVPAIPIDLLMNFYTFCIAQGNEPFTSDEEVIDEATGVKAINSMKELWSLVDREMFTCNPIAVAERMSTSDDYWYCPFAYGYSNYSRTGYAKKLLHYTDVVTFNGNKLRTTIGGTGLSVSAFSQHKEIAIDFAAMAVSGECQRSMYVQHGGQPGHRSAWADAEANG